MKIYGWEEGLTDRGELVCAVVSSVEAKAWPVESFAKELGWERAFSSFKDAKYALVAELEDRGADAETVALLRRIKASYLPATVI